MPSFDNKLLASARLLIERPVGRRGPLPAARVRRSVSTAYYAIFHFVTEQATNRIAGTGTGATIRRRILARMFSHTGLKSTLEKVKGAMVDASIADFMQSTGGQQPVVTPRFVRNLAGAFIDAQQKRHDADYDRNATLSEADAKALIARIESAINDWRRATGHTDTDFKHALSILFLLQGKLRPAG
jgi:hypothetical protein